MNLLKLYNKLSWQSRKYMAIVSCIVILLAGIIIPVLSSQHKDPDEPKYISDAENASSGKATVSLDLNSSTVKENNKNIPPDEKREILASEKDDSTSNTEASNESSSSDNNTEAPPSDSDTGNLQKDEAKALDNLKKNSITKVSNIDEDASSPNKISAVNDNSEDAPKLCSTVFEDHGEVPSPSEYNILYQYPIELGYPVDKNFNGNLSSPYEDLMKMVFKTTPEASDDESSDNDNSSQDDLQETPEEAEQKRLKEFRDNIYKEVLPTEPADQSKNIDAGSTKVINDSNEPSTESTTTKDSDKDTKDSSMIKQKQLKPLTGTLAEYGSSITSEEASSAGSDSKKEDASESESTDNSYQTTDSSEQSSDVSTEAASTEPVSTEATANTDGKGEAANNKESVEADNESTSESSSSSEKSEKVKATDITIDAGDYIVKGPIRKGYSAFVGDITIIPSGVNGFNKIRYEEDGEFKDTVVLQKETAEKTIDLYFTNGSEITHSQFTYSIDKSSPDMKIKEEDTNHIHVIPSSYGDIYCTNRNEEEYVIEDGEWDDSSGISKATLVYGDKIGYIFDGFDNPQYKLPDSFYGRVIYNCTDNAGNTSKLQTQYYLKEDKAPTIQVSESKICTAPYNMAVKIADTGDIVSGIDTITYSINGTTYEPENVICDESVRLADDLDVPSKCQFAINLEEIGSYDIVINVTDHCGNTETLHKTVEVTEAELVAVYMPEHFTIHIDPEQLAGREKIYSDNIHLDNVSNVDVKVTIKSIDLYVNSVTYDNNITKDCDIYMVCPDTGDKILLEKGSNTDVYSYKLPLNADGNITNIYFIGETSKGSELLWEGSDISMHVELDFDKWEIETESEMTEE